MISKIIKTGLRPVRRGMIIWESDRLKEIDRNLYEVHCRVADLELEVRGKFYEFERNLNREVPDHILIDRLYQMMSWTDQKLFDRHRDEYYGDYYGDDSYFDDDYKRGISREISRGISQGIEDAFAGIGERVSAFVKEQEKAQTPAPPVAPPTAPPPAPPAATQQDVAALQAQLAALQQQLAALQKPADTSGTGGGTK